MPGFSSEDVVLLQKVYIRAAAQAREMKMRLAPHEIASHIMEAMQNGERDPKTLGEIALMPSNLMPKSVERASSPTQPAP